jgi:hypothetical protein
MRNALARIFLLLALCAPAAAQVITQPQLGGTTLLSTQVASASASIVFNGLSSAYKHYQIVVDNAVVSGASASLEVQISEDGSTYATTNYSTGGVGIDNSTGLVVLSSNNTAAGIIFAPSLTNSINAPISSMIDLAMPSLSSGRKSILFKSAYVDNASGDNTSLSGGGSYYGSTNAYVSVRILPTSGTITSGSVKLYGYN